MSNSVVESEIKFTFNAPFEKYDVDKNNKSISFLSLVDFVFDTPENLYLIEVKNYQQSKSPLKQQFNDYNYLTTDKFINDISKKFKESLLRLATTSDMNCKRSVICVLVIKLDMLKPRERLSLLKMFRSAFPFGLNDLSETDFKISLEIPNFEELSEKYGITAIINE